MCLHGYQFCLPFLQFAVLFLKVDRSDSAWVEWQKYQSSLQVFLIEFLIMSLLDVVLCSTLTTGIFTYFLCFSHYSEGDDQVWRRRSRPALRHRKITETIWKTLTTWTKRDICTWWNKRHFMKNLRSDVSWCNLRSHRPRRLFTIAD